MTISEFNPASKIFAGNEKQKNILQRNAEPSEIFDPEEAKVYLGCDTALTADYAIVAAEIVAAFGTNNHLHGETIAEVCPGPGNLCGELLSCGAGHVIGIDGSPVMLAHAGDKFRNEIADGNMEFHFGLAQALPLPDNSVDGIVNFNSFHQFATFKRASDAVSEMVRVLKPGGWGFIRDFRRDSDPKSLEGRNTNPAIVKLLQESLPAAFTKQEFETMLLQERGIEFLVIDAPDPWRLSESVCKRIRLDPVKHWKDASVSQHVIFTKFNERGSV
jgi:ubiquinone/menaquinone biosynthesis C-methylase UbiE